jgi:predicted transcriptional regulator
MGTWGAKGCCLQRHMRRVCATLCYMERSLHVRLPEVLAAKLDRFAEAEGMTQSELVRQALRAYLAASVRDSATAISHEIRPKLESEGVTEENAIAWYKKNRTAAKRSKTMRPGANCA